MNESKSHGRVCVVGSINMDLTIRAARLPAPGETILGGPFQQFPGGKGANQAVAAARAGAETTFIGAVGDDQYAPALRSVLEQEGISSATLKTAAGTHTGVGVISIAADGENSIIVASGANMRVDAAHVEACREFIERAFIVMLQLEVPLETNRRVIEIARAAGVIVMLNAAPASDIPADMLAGVDLLVVNETEARMLTAGIADPRLPIEIGGQSPTDRVPEEFESGEINRLASRLGCIKGPETVLTLGSAGCLVLSRRCGTHYPSLPVTSVDSVGAGDAFCGALAAAIAEPRSMRDAVRRACAAGALATTVPGAIPSMPTGAAIDRILLEHGATA